MSNVKGEGVTSSLPDKTAPQFSTQNANEYVSSEYKSIVSNVFVEKCMELYGVYEDHITEVVTSDTYANSPEPEYIELKRLYKLKEENPKVAPLIHATMLHYYFANVSGDGEYPQDGEVVIQSEDGKKEQISYYNIAKFLIKKYCIITIKNRAFIFYNGHYQENEGLIQADIQKILSNIPSTHTKTTDRTTKDICEKVLKLSLLSNKVNSPFLRNSIVIPTKTEALIRCSGKVLHIPKSPAVGKNWYVNAEYIDNIDTTEVFNFLVEVTNKPNQFNQDYAKIILQIGSSAVSQKKYLQQAYMLYGPGSNAKSLIANMYNALFGKPNVSHLKLQDFRNRFALGTLLGKVMNIYPEIPVNSLNSEACSAFKAITGDDSLDFEKKFQDPISDTPTIVMLFSANTLPDVPPDIDAEPAWWRRWIVINLPNCYEKNPEFAEHMTSQPVINQLFKLVVDDISRLEHNGLYKSQDIDTTRELWRCGANNVFRFFITNYEVSDTELPREKWVSKTAIYQHYKHFCEDMDIGAEQIKSDNVFHPILAREKCKIKKTMNDITQKEERYYVNIKEKNTSVIEQTGLVV